MCATSATRCRGDRDSVSVSASPVGCGRGSSLRCIGPWQSWSWRLCTTCPICPPTCLLPLPIQAQTRAGKTQKKSRVNCTDDAVNKPEVELVAAAATMATKDTGATATATAATATATAAATKDSSLLTKKVKLICYFSVDCGLFERCL